MKNIVFTRTSPTAGRLGTAHGSVPTPTFMPVGTVGSVKSLTFDQVRSTGAGIVLGNTYHLHLRPGEAIVQAAGGLAEFGQWQGPMLTDSGGFQVFSLAKIRKITDAGVTFREPKSGDEIFISPEISMQIQFALGADIIMAFDDVVSLDGSEAGREAEALSRTHAWLERCVAEHRRLSKGMATPPALFGIVQGGLDQSLRRRSLEFVQSQPVAGIAIGGLSVGEPRADMFAMLEYLEPMYDAARPHYLMGVGHPLDLRYAFAHGIDMADCVLPTRNARHGQCWITGDETLNLKSERYKADFGPLDASCDCTTCTGGYSRAYLRHLYAAGEVLAGTLVSIHNLRYLQRIAEGFQA